MGQSKILVTGGAGYIGSHTVRMLSDRGYNVIVLDNLVYGHKQAIVNEDVEFVEGDLRDKELTGKIFKENNIEAVMHFSAFAYVGESVKDPAKYYQNNIASPLNLIDVMIEHECMNFIFSSTCATYGDPQYIPIDENHPQNPINPYGKSKYMLEQIIKDYYYAYNFNYAFLRYFNAAGASIDGAIGEDHNPETHLIPLILDAINGERESITVYGTDYDTPDGSCIRDYIHVLDLAEAHILALEHLKDKKEPVICNLGTGQGVSVKEMIKVAEEVTGKKVPVQYGNRRSGDPAKLVANPQYAKTKIGWEAYYKDIKDIVKHAWIWKSGPKKGKFDY